MGLNNLKWNLLRISDCGKVVTGITPSTKKVEYYGNEFMFVSPSDIGEYKYILNSEKKLSGVGFELSKKIPQGSVLFVCIGSTIGKIGIAGKILATNQQINAFIPNKKECSEFLYYAMLKISKRIAYLAKSQAVPIINKTEFESIKILVPPLEEQKRIAKVLSTWDEGIENLEKLIALKEKQKRALMQRLLTGKTRLKGFSTPWKKVKLGDIGVFSSAGVDKKIIEGELSVHLLNYMDVYRNDFIFSKTLKQEVTATLHKKENCNIKRGDVFFTPSSETREDIGHSAVATTDIKDGVYSYHIVRLRPTQDIDLNFSAYIFKTSLFYKQVYTICEGSGQRYVISLEDFRKLVIKIPSSVDEQIEIGNILTTVDNEISQLKNKLEVFKKQKKYLMQQLLTGKKRLV